MIRPGLILVVGLGMWEQVVPTVDLNLRQLQFVSDHLTTKECQLLVAALYQKKIQVQGRQLRPVRDGVPCLTHLADWNQREAPGGTVEDLTLPLHQIGRGDIARVISNAVHKETSYQLHKYFLDDPFKETARHHGSRLMVDDDDDTEGKIRLRRVSARLAHAPSPALLVLSVFGSTVTLLTTVAVMCTCYCRAMWASICPKSVVTMCVAVHESWVEAYSSCRRLAARYVMGREAGPLNEDDPQYQEQQRILQELNNMQV